MGIFSSLFSVGEEMLNIVDFTHKKNKMKLSGKQLSLKYKVLVPVFASVVVMAIVVMWFVYNTSNNELHAFFQESINQKSDFLNDEITRLKAEAYNTTAWFEYSDRLGKAVLAGNRNGVIDLGQEAMQSFNLQYFVVTNAAGDVIARSHEPERYGDNIAKQVNIQKSLAGERSVGLEQGAVVKFSIRAGTPLRNQNDSIIGAVSLGYIIGTEAFVDNIKDVINSEITIFIGSTRYMTTLTNDDGSRIIGTDLNNPEIEQKVLAQNEPYFGESTIQGDLYKSVYMPLEDVRGDVIGMLFCGEEINIINALVNSILGRSLIAVLVIATGVLIFLNFVVLISVVRPVKMLVSQAEEVAAGNLAVKVKAHGQDEIGHLSIAIQKMVTSLRKVVEEVLKATDHFSSASQQMSVSAQQLSEGSTAQASSAEEISSSMEEMVANIDQNADNARQTEQIIVQSVTGVKEGNDSSSRSVDSMRNIADKITIINDIAFQTNILALNAAVEAARAGEHGKGFAVVAAEVRKLAERSKVAAEEIIQLSDGGVTVAETAGEKLKLLVPEIEKTARLVEEISSASLEQRSGSDQINGAIQSLNQIVQQNASSSQELATSSEELASQAENLKDTMQFFKI